MEVIESTCKWLRIRRTAWQPQGRRIPRSTTLIHGPVEIAAVRAFLAPQGPSWETSGISYRHAQRSRLLFTYIYVLRNCTYTNLFLLLRRMRPSKIAATRLLHRLEIHQFHPHQVRIIQIELPFPVFAQLCLFVAVRLPAV